jgi:alkylated DNA repair dioxygenase AlkB
VDETGGTASVKIVLQPGNVAYNSTCRALRIGAASVFDGGFEVDFSRYIYVNLYASDFINVSTADFIALNFSHRFAASRRQALFFGCTDYSYGGVSHKSRSVPPGSPIKIIADKMAAVFPGLKFNSILVNYYPVNESYIPFHSDDEPEIVANSYITTLSIGGTRTLAFRKKRCHKIICSTIVKHGSITIFPQNSQYLYEHSILRGDVNCLETDQARISLTFRKLEKL